MGMGSTIWLRLSLWVVESAWLKFLRAPTMDDLTLYAWLLVGHGRLNSLSMESIDSSMLSEFLIPALVPQPSFPKPWKG